jgi:catecholate siderophore receptor
MMKNKHKLLLSLSAIFALTSLGHAQNNPSELSPMSVVESNSNTPTLSSGMKTSMPTRDIPQSLSIITSEQIKAQGLKSIGDVIDYTAGVNTSQGEGHRDAAVIRGVRTTQDFYRDGIRDDVQYYRPLYNIDQVEVLRGPNALLSGFGGAYGIINRASKKGVIGESFNTVSGSIDTFGETNVQLDSNYEIAEDKAFRINMFGENLENHRDYYYGDSFGVNPTMKYLLGDGSILDLSYEYLNQERFIDRGIPTGNNFMPIESLKDYVFADPSQNFSTHEAHIFKAVYEHELSDSLTGRFVASHSDHDKLYQNVYVSGYFNSPVAGDSTSALPIELDGYIDTTQRSTTVLNYSVKGEYETGGIVHNIIAGIEYIDTSNDNDRYNSDWNSTAAGGAEDEAIFALSRQTLNNGFGTGAITPLTTAGPISNNYTSDRKDKTLGDLSVFSIYVRDEIALTDKLDLILGLRYDHMEYDVDSYSSSDVITSLTDSDDTLSPRAGLIFDLTQEASLYASFSETFTQIAGDQYASLKSWHNTLDPNTFENTEVGLRYTLPNGLNFGVSAFKIDSKMAEEFPANSGTYVHLESETTGFEFELSGSLTEKWFISAGYTNLDAENVNGDRLRESPENMFSIWNKYLISDRLALNMGIIYQDESLMRQPKSDGTTYNQKLPDYTRLDVGATYALTDNTRLQVNIENLTDEVYFPNSHSTHQASVGAPVNATFGITSSF